MICKPNTDNDVFPFLVVDDFYNQDEIYKDKKVPENLRGLRNGLASELLHKKMVDMQYEGMD